MPAKKKITFHGIESAKYNMVKLTQILERRLTIYQGMEKVLALCFKLYDKKAGTTLITLDKFLQRNKILSQYF